jgi:hypothetical protein
MVTSRGTTWDERRALPAAFGRRPHGSFQTRVEVAAIRTRPGRCPFSTRCGHSEARLVSAADDHDQLPHAWRPMDAGLGPASTDTCPALSSADAEAAPFDDQIPSCQAQPGRVAAAGVRNVQPATAPAAPVARDALDHHGPYQQAAAGRRVGIMNIACGRVSQSADSSAQVPPARRDLDMRRAVSGSPALARAPDEILQARRQGSG